jgi:hypothetical protein
MGRLIDTQAIINWIRLKTQSGNPVAPASGYDILYSKSDGLYFQNSSGSAVAITSALASHINATGSEVHSLGTISGQSASAVNLTGGSLVSEYARFGTETDNTSFELDGTMLASGSATVWVDELGDVTKLRESGTGITESATEIAVGFETGMNYTSDYLYTNIQLNHYRKLATLVNPHIHFWQSTSSFPNLLVLYRWQKNGSAKEEEWKGLAATGGVYSYDSGELNQIAILPSITPPSGDGVSDILQFRVSRDKTNSSGSFIGQDTLNSTVYLTSFDVHFLMDTLGSRTEYTK